MKCIVSEPTWGAYVIEDADSNEFSFQCLCGGVGMYWQRALLTPDEVQGLRDGTLDPKQIVSDICKQKPNIKDRLVPSVDTENMDSAFPRPKYPIRT